MFNRPGEVKAVLQTVSSLNLAWTHKTCVEAHRTLHGSTKFAWRHNGLKIEKLDHCVTYIRGYILVKMVE